MTRDDYTVLLRMTEIALAAVNQNLQVFLIGPTPALRQWQRFWRDALDFHVYSACPCGNRHGTREWKKLNPCFCKYSAIVQHMHVLQANANKYADMVFLYKMPEPPFANALFATADMRMIRETAREAAQKIQKNPQLLLRAAMQPVCLGNYQEFAGRYGDLAVRRRRIAALIAILDGHESIEWKHWAESDLYCRYQLPPVSLTYE